MHAETSTLRERRKGTAVWKQIEQAIMGDILSGQIAPGDRLPSESALAARFSVNRHTIRRTLAELTAQDVVRIENGRGAFLREDFVRYRLSSSARFWETLLRDGHAPGVDLVASGEVAASAVVAQDLHVGLGEPMVFLDALGSANGRRVVLARHCFLTSRFPDLVTRYKEKGSIKEALASYGVQTRRTSIRICARLPNEEEASTFGQPWPQPVLQVDSVYADQNGIPVDHGVARYASALVQLDIEL